MLSVSREKYNCCEKRACWPVSVQKRLSEHKLNVLQYFASHLLLLNASKTNGLGFALTGMRCTTLTCFRQWKKALINLLSKNADCWTCLNSGIKYLYRGGREQRSKALLKFSAGLFSCISSAQSILCFPSVGWGQSLWPSFQTQSTFCTYYKGCNYNLWSLLKCTHTSWWGWLFCALGASC